MRPRKVSPKLTGKICDRLPALRPPFIDGIAVLGKVAASIGRHGLHRADLGDVRGSVDTDPGERAPTTLACGGGGDIRDIPLP